MVTLDFKTLTVPVGILRILAVVFTCVTFSLVASQGHSGDSFWSWCMFSWCFCFSVTLIILVLEFTGLSSKLPISWDDFTTAFAMLATLMIHPGAAMAYMNLKSITHPVGILRILAVIVTCITFSLVASVKPDSSPYWGWCMFTWIFCCFFTLLILILEFTTISTKVPFAWEDFTAAFAILSSVMCLCAAIMYPTFFACNTCHRQIGASVVSWICFAVYVAEVVLTRLRPSGQDNGFLSTPPGIMKMLESFFACLIFLSLESDHYSGHQYAAGLNWCIAVYSLCFIFTITIILLTLGKLTVYFPFPFEMVVIACNVLAAVMYLTAMVMWPLYSFQNSKRPVTCGRLCSWDTLVLITVMTIFNSIVYLLDSIYSILVVFVFRNE